MPLPAIFYKVLDMKIDSKQGGRISDTLACRDSDSIPKVSGAGDVFMQDECSVQRMHNGVLIHEGSYHGEWMMEIIQGLKGHHEPQEEKVFNAVLECIGSGATMIELGSFWAYYSLWFKSRIADSRSILVEPEPDKLRAGKENFALNEFEGTFINAFAGANSVETAEFADWDGTRSVLPKVSIDSLMEEYKIDTLDILHSDIQGAESEMLKGASSALSEGRVKYVFISTHGHEHRKCLGKVKKYGYRIIAEHSVLESFSADGLIVAASPNTPTPPIVSITKKDVSLLKKTRYALSFVKTKIFPPRELS
ncbi:FkbM family methyltransferase [Verrucomicrobiales bacterium]|nr:FkbM family methyltransferase [Verrucomicrobiales bacterium]